MDGHGSGMPVGQITYIEWGNGVYTGSTKVNKVYVVTSTYENSGTYYIFDIYESYQTEGYTKDTFIENVTSYNENAYPDNGEQQEGNTMFWYVKKAN